jgi:putative ABC transport system substrate-binding protein
VGANLIGFLTEVPNVAQAAYLRDFLRGTAELGYVEGKNFAAEYRLNPESLPQAATDLVRRNVNVFVASEPAAVAAVSKATTSIHVVAIDLESDPVAKRYLKSLARPDGNITGVFLDIPELSGKQLELLKEIVPRLSRVAIFGIYGSQRAAICSD